MNKLRIIKIMALDVWWVAKHVLMIAAIMGIFYFFERYTGLAAGWFIWGSIATYGIGAAVYFWFLRARERANK